MVVNLGAYCGSSYPANALGKLGFDYDWLLTTLDYSNAAPSCYQGVWTIPWTGL